MRYISIDDLVRFAFDNKWMYCEHVEDLRPFIEEGIAQGKVRSMDTDCSDGIDRLEDLEERVKKLEEAMQPKNCDYGSYTDYIKKFDAKTIIFGTRGEAEITLHIMRERLKEQRAITVADYYLLAAKPEYISYVTYDYGWTNLDNVSIYSFTAKGGKRVWGLRLPDPLPVQRY